MRSFLSASELFLDHDDISLNDEHCHIKISEKKIKDSEDVIYSLVLSSEMECEPVKLLKTIRQVICSIKDDNSNDVTVLELQNDYARNRSEKLYSLIYAVENTMRKLLTRFMLENLGMKWYEATPANVMDSVKEKRKYQWGKDCLYHVDFIQLAYFLLTPYSKEKDIPWKIIKKALNSEISKEERECVERSIPANNWDRYFKKLVNWDSGKFGSKWEKLYEYRNTIAHNRILQMNEYEVGKSLCDEIQKLLDEAIDKLNRVKISKEEKVNVVETMDAIFPKSILESISNFQKIAESFKPLTSVVESFRVPEVKSLVGVEDISNNIMPSRILSDCLANSFIKTSLNMNRIAERMAPIPSSTEKKDD